MSNFKFEQLSEMALKVISKDFNKHCEVMNIEDSWVRTTLFQNLNIKNANIDILCAKIKHEEFWSLACKKMYSTSVPENNSSHKSLYLENYLQNYLRKTKQMNADELMDIMHQIGKFIISLRITDQRADELLGTVFPFLVNIQSLRLNVYSKNNKLFDTKNFGMTDLVLTDLTNSFRSFSKLRKLDLSNNQLDSSKIEILCQGICFLKELESLNLSRNKIDNLALETLNQEGNLGLCKKLQVIDLSGNELVEGCGKTLEELVFNTKNSLKCIYLQGNLISNSDLAKICNAFIIHNSLINEINLANNVLDESSFAVILNFLENCKKLKFVDLEMNLMKLCTTQVESLNAIMANNFAGKIVFNFDYVISD